MNINNFINKYINSKSLAWSSSTLKSELARLNAVSIYLNGDPELLWFSIKYKPYTINTLWTRVSQFWQYLIDENLIESKINNYKQFREKNKRLFKFSYSPNFPKVTFEQVKSLLKDSKYQDFALRILKSGARFCEAVQNSSNPLGKGNKRRKLYASPIESHIPSYQAFRRDLAKIGLKPHDLRKLCATELVKLGLKEIDLLEVMGWSNISTAKYYLKPKNELELTQIFDRM